MRWMLETEESDTLAERVKLLYWNANNSIFITFSAFTVMCILQLDTAPNYIIVTFITLMFSVCVLRFIDAKRKPIASYDFSLNPKQDFKNFSSSILTTGCIWASFNVVFMQEASLLELAFNAVILAAMTGGAITVLGAARRVVMVYATLLLVPFCIIGFFVNFENFYLISILGLGYWVMAVKSSAINSAFINKTLNIAAENDELLRSLTHEKQSLSESNKALTAARETLNEYTYQLEQKVQERTDDILRLSNLDALTGLYNRKVLHHEVEQFLQSDASNSGCALLFLDLNDFKEINDQMGHFQGDLVLKVIADRLDKLRKTLSPNIILGRWGGDEFVVLAKAYNHDNINDIICKLQNEISKPVRVGGVTLSVSTCIGVSFYPEHSDNADQLIQYADMAMYQSKHAGVQVQPIFQESLKQKYKRQQNLKLALGEAIAKNEFFLVYQPIMCSVSNMPVGVEVLLRWQHKDELISPVEFIPIAEKSDLIVDIGLWVLRKSCEEFVKIKPPSHIYLSVNISAMQLKQDLFVESIDEALRDTGFAANQLQLEITETLILEEKQNVEKVIKTLRDKGIRIAIDDFGTGYSSLKQLQDITFDSIKIDRSFIVNMTEKDVAILSAADFIARQLGASTIIEGVETLAQIDDLKLLGLHCCQGFFFAKPMRIEKMNAWLKTDFNSAQIIEQQATSQA
ncbi:putative bifunctional diguanylate cyclase/phosphodiesterase [Glaciecola sp. SC05]|uniref:putative bifunctional diguanylate cyclase/phosphodiesterase n=1 Tax=Glaciecola sp. SC05 TaxID=1987355 RepID=UPI0035283A1F